MKKISIILLLLLTTYCGFAQTFYAVTHTAGTLTIPGSGRDVTVASSGAVGAVGTLCLAVATPYWEGSTLSTPGTYTWNFDLPVYALRMHIAGINLHDDVSFTINGAAYCVAGANLSAYGFECFQTATATATGCIVINAVGNGQVQVDITDCTGINSASVTSTGIAMGVQNDFLFNPNETPSFPGGSPQAITVCKNSAPVSIDALLKIHDDNVGQLETWTVISGPSSGTVVLGGTGISNGGNISPTGCTYQPATGFSGTDAFTVQIKDCMGATSTTVINVTVEDPTITGNLHVCLGGTSLLTGTPGGGAWSSTVPTVATVGISGLVNGIALGTSTISYTSLSGCAASAVVTVVAAPNIYTVISVGTAYCPGSAGVEIRMYSSSDIGVNYELFLNGVSTGTILPGTGAGYLSFGFRIGVGIYTVKATSAAGCSVLMSGSPAVNLLPVPGPISGTLSVCVGGTSLLTDAPAGGTWSSTVPPVATITSGGLVTGMALGTSVISYTNSFGCAATAIFTVTPPVPAISGPTSVCMGYSMYLYDPTVGGVWSSGSPAIATINTEGMVTGMHVGVAVMTYSIGGCFATYSVTVKSIPAPITGPSAVCTGYTITLSDATPSGTWSNMNPLLDNIGVVSGVLTSISTGTDIISYTGPNGCFTIVPIIDNPTPYAITGGSIACTTVHTALADAMPFGVWSSSNTAIATVSTAGVVSPVTSGSFIITYTIPSTGCYNTNPMTISTGCKPSHPAIGENEDQPGAVTKFNVYPNPTSDKLNIETQNAGTFSLYSLEGKELQKYEISAGKKAIDLPTNLAPGIYLCRFTDTNGSSNIIRLVYEPK